MLSDYRNFRPPAKVAHRNELSKKINDNSLR